MASKLAKVVIYHEELPLIKLLDPSITWFCKVTWHVKYFSTCTQLALSTCNISTCTRPMAIKHGKMMTHTDELPPIHSHNPLNMCSRGPRVKLKTYLHHYNAYDHKTYRCSGITQGVPTHKFGYPLNEVVM